MNAYSTKWTEFVEKSKTKINKVKNKKNTSKFKLKIKLGILWSKKSETSCHFGEAQSSVTSDEAVAVRSGMEGTCQSLEMRRNLGIPRGPLI